MFFALTPKYLLWLKWLKHITKIKIFLKQCTNIQYTHEKVVDFLLIQEMQFKNYKTPLNKYPTEWLNWKRQKISGMAGDQQEFS